MTLINYSFMKMDPDQLFDNAIKVISSLKKIKALLL